MDGSSTPSASGIGIILTSLDKEVIEYALRFAFPTSNNEAEYEALITSLKLSKEMNILELKVFSGP